MVYFQTEQTYIIFLEEKTLLKGGQPVNSPDEMTCVCVFCCHWRKEEVMRRNGKRQKRQRDITITCCVCTSDWILALLIIYTHHKLHQQCCLSLLLFHFSHFLWWCVLSVGERLISFWSVRQFHHSCMLFFWFCFYNFIFISLSAYHFIPNEW